MLDEKFKNYKKFLRDLLKDLSNTNIKIDNKLIDHICYKVSSLDEYEKSKSFLNSLGTKITELNVNGRPIATYKLYEPLEIYDFKIPLFELPAPKSGLNIESCYDHIEIVIGDNGFAKLLNENPELNWKTKCQHLEINPDISIKLKSGIVKFHPTSLEKVIEEEQKCLPDNADIVRK